MNVAVVMLGSLVLLSLGYRFYSGFVARQIGVDPDRPTPAVSKSDGTDYVPTRPFVLFSHHFASIAAAGPIVGPTLAMLYGFLPAWLWIVAGVILIGAVHDFTSLLVTAREGGHSLAEVTRRTLGQTGFIFFISFAIILCILVCAAFLDLAATALTSLYPVAALGAGAEGMVRTKVAEAGPFAGQEVALLGGIASTSVVVMTLAAPLLGWLIHRRRSRMWELSLLALALCAVSIAIGFRWPITLAPQVWMTCILVYAVFAAFIPVWLVLQPRDFVNVHLLYIGMAAMVGGIIACGFQGVTISAPPLNLAEGSERMGPWWPILFVTIACGACSGAHGLVCGGTTCKQLANERHARPIGYGAMLMEALLGISVLLMLGGALGMAQYREIVYPLEGTGNAPLAFAMAVGATLNTGFGFPIVLGAVFGILLLEGFLLTTLDTLIRLTRYLFEELWNALGPATARLAKVRLLNSFLPVALTALLAYDNYYREIWPVFGSANQLLAALTLCAITAWLIKNARPYWFAAFPAGFMAVTTISSMFYLLYRHVTADEINYLLTGADVLLLVLSGGVVTLCVRFFLRMKKELAQPAAGKRSG